MNHLLLLPVLAMAAGPVSFERHDIDSFPGGYQVAVADLTGDGKPDVIALSTGADRVDWYENPGWKRRPVARTPKNIDLAVRDIDGDGQLEIAVAAGFDFNDAARGGEIYLLRRPKDLDRPWPRQLIGTDPVTHRIRWGDLDGDGRPELVHAPIFGPGSKANIDPKPSHLWAFRPPKKLDEAARPWEVWKIDETLTVLHGLWVGDLAGDGRDEVLTASFEGIFRFDFEGERASGRWKKIQITAGAKPVSDKPGAARGSSEVVPGRLGPKRPFIAAIDPWHGHEVVVYTPPKEAGKLWDRHVLDDSLSEGHAVVTADFDGDGADEIVAGWRAGTGGLAYYDAVDASGRQWKKTMLDRGIAVEGLVVCDISGDGRLDLVAIAGRTNNLAWYENKGR